MRVLQVIAGFCMFTFPYFLLYFKFGLKDNFNNSYIFRSTLLYSLLTLILKVFVMATGVPELLAKFLLPEKLVFALLNTASTVGVRFALTSKASMTAKCDHRILSVAMYWSLVNNLFSCGVVTWKVFKSFDHTLKFYFFALNSNLGLVGSLCNCCLVLMYLRSRVVPKELYGLLVGYVLLFPVMGVFAYNEEIEVDRTQVVVFAVQAVLGLAFAFLVRYYYNKKYRVNKDD